MQTETIYFNFKGGIISPGYLMQLLTLAADAQVTDLRFGLRQQLIVDVPAEKFVAFANACQEKQMVFFREQNRLPNLVSSYAGVNIFTPETWLSEGVYKDVFDLFNYQPLMKVNICDSRQHFTPLFTGHLNWVASSHQHYWFLYIRLPKTDRVLCWPELIYTNDLAHLSLQLERIILSIQKQNGLVDNLEIGFLYQLIKQSAVYISKPINGKLVLPVFHLPYYEGFNKEGNNYWLGIYRRNELFSISFLKDLCKLCLQNKTGEIYATTWKSLIIKGIAPSARQQWDQVLGRHRINVRHAANELNWQVEDRNEDGLVLKRHIIRYFDKEDVRTYGLCFAVKTQPSSNLFGSVLIRRQQRKNVNKLKSFERYDILYKKDFNPNGNELILFREHVEKDHLGTYLVSLCKYFYEQEQSNTLTEPVEEEQAVHESQGKPAEWLYQCSTCLSVYDEQLEDDQNQVVAGTSFEALPETYECTLCGEAKNNFVKIEKASLHA